MNREGWRSGTVRANGVDLRYDRVGDGPPVVLAHGFYDSGRRWVPLAEDLADDYDVVAYDARGHGHSDASETGYDIQSRVADLVGVVEALELDDPVLVGHSMGAATCAWTAVEHPGLARALVLEDPLWMHGDPELGPDERAEVVRERLAEAADRSVEELVAEHYADRDPEQARRLATATHECSPSAAEIGREGYPRPLHEVLPEVRCPTLVLKRDGDTDQRVTDLETADALPGGRLVHVHGAGHYVFGTGYDAAYAELRAFLARR